VCVIEGTCHPACAAPKLLTDLGDVLTGE
jgi:hypothetical protein